jgi:2-oxopent-4-enoate/cis-2-oxohex-4-enoate hydratase
MDMLKVNQPDFGQLTSGMVFNEGEADRLVDDRSPRPRPKSPSCSRSDLMGPGVTAADVLRATDCVVPCFEIVDSRIKDWKIKIQDTVADNASCGVLVLGGVRRARASSTSRSPAWCWRRTASIISTSTGAAVQGSPVNAVAWLANTLGAWASASRPAR